MPIPLIIAGVTLTAAEVAAFLGLTAATAATVVVVSSTEYQQNAQATGAAIEDGITSLFSGNDVDEQAPPIAQTQTNTTTRACDGPHGGRLQVQGYRPRVDPHPIEISWPWNRPCIPPLRPEGLSVLSAVLLPATMAIKRSSAGHRGPAFAAMSRFISRSSPWGFTPADSDGWSINEVGRAVRNRTRGVSRNAPRVDMEIHRGRAFGDQ